MRVAAVSFDADDTLWDFTAVMRRALTITLRQLRQWYPGPATEALTIDDMITIRESVASQRNNDWSGLEDIRRAAFAETLRELGEGPSRADDLNELYLHHRFEDTELYPDVLPCLDSLDPDLPVGLLSNGNSYPERCGLSERLAFVVFAQDHGVAKPDPHLFRIAAQQAGCRLEHLVHVGDGESDIDGAKRAGCRSVLIHRTESLPSYAKFADAIVSDLRALPKLIRALDTS